MGHWFEELADHMGSAYLRYSFTKGTVQEVDHIVDVLGLAPGQRVLDIGCGPGRHSHELARRGIEAHGVDISERFVELAQSDAPVGSTFERVDARQLPFDEEFDALICLCQGAFGLMTAEGEDDLVIGGIARALRPGGRVALSAFSSYFVVKHWDDADFDADTGVNHEITEIRSETGDVKQADLWTGCYTPRELRLLLEQHGISVDSISSVEPGAYGVEAPDVDSPEFLVVASKELP
jgi:cyclopropane fatty-acyl-phospholipid synthase-like methyltransferase